VNAMGENTERIKWDSKKGRQLIIEIIETDIPAIKNMRATQKRWAETKEKIMQINFKE
jgi:hypothetical protein